MSPFQIIMDLEKRIRQLRADLNDLVLKEGACCYPNQLFDPCVIEVIEEQLLPALEAVDDAINYDPTPQYAYDHFGGEPPVTADELHDRSIAQRRELRGGIMQRGA